MRSLSSVVLAVALATAAVAVSGGGTATAREVAGAAAESSTFTPVPPVRVLDTRGGPAVAGGRTITLDLAGRLPSTATAVVLNVTGVAPTVGTYVTAYPAGSARPTVSSLNLAPGETRANLVTVAVGASRAVSLYNHLGRYPYGSSGSPTSSRSPRPGARVSRSAPTAPCGAGVRTGRASSVTPGSPTPTCRSG